MHRAAHIQEELLPQLYNELATHLTKMGVEPQIYMMYLLNMEVVVNIL